MPDDAVGPGQPIESREDFGEGPVLWFAVFSAGGHFMQLYIVRHGIAVDGGEGVPDGSRPLTDKGRRRFQKAARAFGKLGHKLDLILTSPLVRAVQTAEILAGAVKHGEVAVLEELDPKFDVETLRAVLAKRAGRSGAVAIVGHEPQLSSVLAAISGVSQADIDLKKGAIVRVDASTLTDGKPADVRWWLKPKTGTQIKGPPLQKQAAKKLRSAARVQLAPKRKRVASKARPRKRPVEPRLKSPSLPTAATAASNP
jgi:phosphohistidine phosphatase